MNNLEILENWYVLFKNKPKFSFDEVKEIIFKAQLEDDLILKKKLYVDAFEYMMHPVYVALKNSKIIYLADDDVTMEDYIGAACETVYAAIINGNILNYHYFSVFFHRDFFNLLSIKTTGIRIKTELYIGVPEAKLISLIGEHLPAFEEDSTDLIIQGCQTIKPDITKHQNDQLKKLINYILDICKKYELTITDLNYYFRIILNKAIRDNVISFISENNLYKNNTVELDIDQDLRTYIEKYSPNFPVSREILLRFYGFADGTPWSYKELGEHFNMPVRNVAQLINYFENFMGGFKSVRKCAKLYGYDIDSKVFTRRKRDYVRNPWPRTNAKNRWK